MRKDWPVNRYDIIAEEDIKAAKRKVDTNRTAPGRADAEAQKPSLPPELVGKLSTLAEDKLIALVALLSI